MAFGNCFFLNGMKCPQQNLQEPRKLSARVTTAPNNRFQCTCDTSKVTDSGNKPQTELSVVASGAFLQSNRTTYLGADLFSGRRHFASRISLMKQGKQTPNGTKRNPKWQHRGAFWSAREALCQAKSTWPGLPRHRRAFLPPQVHEEPRV